MIASEYEERTATACYGNLAGNLEGQRVIHPHHRKLTVFGHFANVDLPPAAERTDIIIVRLPNKWFWIISLSADKTSVGLVIDQEEFAAGRGDGGGLAPTGRLRRTGVRAV